MAIAADGRSDSFNNLYELKKTDRNNPSDTTLRKRSEELNKNDTALFGSKSRKCSVCVSKC